ncbi:hypothetical protein [Streptomyces sp. NPDC058295]|uniref:hypothetical protein n=1 Tax=Streptomyces sp. NPDC058295 TaxID=3346431 RepID=UPI0036EC5C1D
MSYGWIERGPMAADNFTQISNSLFRDPRLSAKAKGIFGFISTHRSGWGLTPESIAAAMKDGVSAIKGGLRELEAFGYLGRTQRRKPDGTMGPVVYRITDMPRSEPVDGNLPAAVTCKDSESSQVAVETCRSEPADENPPAANPPAANHPHKKTIPQNTSSKNTTSPSRPPLGLVPSPAEDQGGGGGDAPQQQEKQDTAAAAFVDRLPYGARIPGPRQRAHLVERVSTALAAGWTEWALRVQLTEETDSAKSLYAVYRHRLSPEWLPAAPPLPKPRTGDDGPSQATAMPGRARCQCGNPYFPSADVDDDRCKECRSESIPAPVARTNEDYVRAAAVARKGIAKAGGHRG